MSGMDAPALLRLRQDRRPADNPAGCGSAAASWLHAFNPVLQGERFDPSGRYVRRLLPELAGLPGRFIHRPWDTLEPVLRGAGLVLRRDHSRPVVEHAEGRRRALAAFAALRAETVLEEDRVE